MLSHSMWHCGQNTTQHKYWKQKNQEASQYKTINDINYQTKEIKFILKMWLFLFKCDSIISTKLAMFDYFVITTHIPVFNIFS